MTISRLGMCCLLLFAPWLLLPSTIGAQGKQWTDKECKARMEQLFKYARDPSVDIREVTDNLGIRAGTEFAMYCGTKEAKSIRQLERQLEQLVAAREQMAESERRVDKYGRHLENMQTQSPIYDPGGFGGRY